MNTVIRGALAASEITLSDLELSARLGYSTGADDEKMIAVTREILGDADIKFVATRLGFNVDCSRIDFGGFSVESRALSAYFGDLRETYLFVLTLGIGVDRLIMKKKAVSISDGFIFDAVASAIVEAACDAAEEKICGTTKTKTRFSPGYADCPLDMQRHVIDALSADKYIGVKLLESSLMSPMKSVSAFLAILP